MTVKASATITLFDVSDGEDGTSVTVKSIAYATSTTNTKPSTISGSFPSTLTKGTYLWTRVTYSDGSKADTVSYLGTDGDITEAISQAKAAAQAVVDDIEIGGRNLLLNTSDFKGWHLADSSIISIDGTTNEAYFSSVDSDKWYEIAGVLRDFKDVIGKTLTFSVEVKSTGSYVAGRGLYTVFCLTNSTSNSYRQRYLNLTKNRNKDYSVEYPSNLSSDWIKCTATFTVAEDGTGLIIEGDTSVTAFTKYDNSPDITDETHYFIQIFNHSTNDLYVRHPKLEIGNKATDWTPAPEDVDDDISDAVNASEAAMLDAYKDYLKTTLGIEEGFTMDLNSVDKFLKAGIIDKDGASLMTQTEDGWVFSISDLQKDIASAASAASSAAATANTATGNLSNLNKNLSDNGVWDLTSQIKIVKSSDGKSAQITIGGSNEFTLELTNNQIAFKQASETVAYIKSNKEYISRAQLTDELQFGGEDEDPNYVFKTHNNGNNLGIIWKGDD